MDCTYEFKTPQGPLLYRESSLHKLHHNDTSKYEDSMKELMEEYRDFTKKSDLVSSRKYKFKKFLPVSRKLKN